MYEQDHVVVAFPRRKKNIAQLRWLQVAASVSFLLFCTLVLSMLLTGCKTMHKGGSTYGAEAPRQPLPEAVTPETPARDKPATHVEAMLKLRQ